MYADGSTLTPEELSVLRRAQQGGRKVGVGLGASSRSFTSSYASRSGARPAQQQQQQQQYAPYPEASTHTLQLLGQIDALLKAPPEPPTWALHKILSVLERHAAKH
jgi:hypothetical protein